MRDPYRLPLLIDPQPAGWQHRANCLGEDPELFFPEAKGGRDLTWVLSQIDKARTICSTCPVRNECAELGQRQDDGIFAGVFKSSIKGLEERVARAEQEGIPHTDCGICGETFIPRRAQDLYCSWPCRRTADRERKRKATHKGAA